MTDPVAGTRHTIRNRHGLAMNVWVDGDAGAAAPVAFILHGFSGHAGQPHMRAMTAAFRARAYTTVTVDATHSFNSSDGAIEHANLNTHTDDLADVIDWARGQHWFRAPFALAGQSMGGGAVLKYALKHPGAVSHLVAAASLISGKLYRKAWADHNPQGWADWQRTGYQRIQHNGREHRRYWDHTVRAYDQFDSVRNAKHLTMPVLLVAGSLDTLTPASAHAALHQALPGQKEFHVINGAHHCFEQRETALQSVMDSWLRKQHEKTFRQNRRPFDLG